MYQLLISDESRLDILDAYDWYEKKKSGLGFEFQNCLDAAMNSIQSNPLKYQKRYRNLHIHFITRFPYGIHYLIEKDTVKVFGIFHTSRNPKSWIRRS